MARRGLADSAHEELNCYCAHSDQGRVAARLPGSVAADGLPVDQIVLPEVIEEGVDALGDMGKRRL